MGKRLLEEKRFNIFGKVVSMNDFKPCTDLKDGFKVTYKDELVSKAEPLIDKEYSVLKATDYMMYVRNGNRNIFEYKKTQRRIDLLTLALAEYAEDKGRFTDSIINLVWMIMEETSWVIPASNNGKPLPYAYREKVDNIELFNATTGAAVATVYFLCGEKLAKESEIITDRILYELDRRLITPFLDNTLRNNLWWTGCKGNVPNNWNPWIISNILTVTAFAVQDMHKREAVVDIAMRTLDNFIQYYKDDGGCDEGPGYWSAAGGAYLNCLLLLNDLTNGYVNIFEEELVKKMGEYEVKANINGQRFINFADCPAKIAPNLSMLYDFGINCKSEMMTSYVRNKLNGKKPDLVIDRFHPYRLLRSVTYKEQPPVPFKAPLNFYLDGIIIAGSRESEDTSKGLYLALKGGNNGESHNHNDIGTIIVFADGNPIFIDAGSGAYTKRTFSKDRYSIWAMCSDYHNIPTINGVNQKSGINYCSKDHVYDKTNGKLQMNLKYAYPEEANIKTYIRSGVLEKSCVTISDQIELNEEGEIIFNYLCNTKPTDVKENSFVLHGKTVNYDDSLAFTCEEVDCSEPEVERIPKNWDTDIIYRIRLKTKKSTKGKEYILTVR